MCRARGRFRPPAARNGVLRYADGAFSSDPGFTEGCRPWPLGLTGIEPKQAGSMSRTQYYSEVPFRWATRGRAVCRGIDTRAFQKRAAVLQYLSQHSNTSKGTQRAHTRSLCLRHRRQPLAIVELVKRLKCALHLLLHSPRVRASVHVRARVCMRACVAALAEEGCGSDLATHLLNEMPLPRVPKHLH